MIYLVPATSATKVKLWPSCVGSATT